jgi:hypothetical protein
MSPIDVMVPVTVNSCDSCKESEDATAPISMTGSNLRVEQFFGIVVLIRFSRRTMLLHGLGKRSREQDLRSVRGGGQGHFVFENLHFGHFDDIRFVLFDRIELILPDSHLDRDTLISDDRSSLQFLNTLCSIIENDALILVMHGKIKGIHLFSELTGPISTILQVKETYSPSAVV